MTGSDLGLVTTARLAVRLPREADRDRLVGLFCDEDFMVFSPGAIVALENLASQKVCRKLGFTFWKQATVEGHVGNLYTLRVGEPVGER